MYRAKQGERHRSMKGTFMKLPGESALLACLSGTQLINRLGGKAPAMSLLRAPFHHPFLLRAILDQPIPRTLAGYPNAVGTKAGPGVSARLSVAAPLRIVKV
jgi:hypothetical protein